MSVAAFLNVSDVASFINQNKWNYIEPFVKLWKKYDSETYNKIILISKTKNFDQKIDKIKYVEETLGTNFVKNIIDNTKTKQDIVKTIESSNIQINNLNISHEEKNILNNTIESIVNTSHGINNENPALIIYTNKTKSVVNTSQEFHKIKIHNTDKYEWFLGAKVDGLTSTKIIEVKTRSYCFFKNIREYENTQIQLYMYIYNLNYADLVEYFNSKIKITEIKKNMSTVNTILNNLIIFINAFELFLNDSFDEKLYFYNLNENDKKDFLHNMYLSKMN